jgi:tetratricopeptide (TPR) repeat protein
MIPILAIALAVAAPEPAPACPSVLTPKAQTCRALEASKAGKFAEAAAAFESAADLTPSEDPAHDRALAAAGNMWIAAGQPGKAALSLDKALAGKGLLADQHGLALLDRARAAEAQGDLTTARAKLNEAAKTIGEDPFLWYFSAALSIREEDIPAAKSSINRALTMVPDSPEVMFEAGHVFHAAGEDAKAREYWTKAMMADPNGPTGKAAREALAMADAPLTVTNQVATRPEGDGEGPKDQ